MALINIDAVLQETLRRLKSCPPGGGIELMSYKRNRTIALIIEIDDRITFIERGYRERHVTIALAALKKELKGAIQTEFPRSRKVRLVKFTSPEELNRIHQKI